ncbi:MAG TPA: sigma-54 dependent transcriptional regulator [Acidobacteriaceae bacterium]|nr:sigma-54 dependent transcriptional regulator [Acidobacteriaceae bacterium]
MATSTHFPHSRPGNPSNPPMPPTRTRTSVRPSQSASSSVATPSAPATSLLQSWPGSSHAIMEEMQGLRILVVDDDISLRKACCEIASSMGLIPYTAGSVAEALSVLKEHQPIDLLLLDLKLPGGGGLSLLSQVKVLYPKIGVVVMTAFATVSSAVEAMRIGAGDYLTKPFALDELTTVLTQSSQRLHYDLQSRKLRERLRTPRGMGNLIGISPGMEKVYRILSKVAFSNHPVLILGESGTGKELVARAIHFDGPNAAKPFVPVDCSSLVPTLIESELFGHVKGAFTGANRNKEGLLASADGGTVFLDEIGELPLDLQARLLRALQEKEVRPVGATQAVPISARILAATNRDLTAMVEQGHFRRDLYFRLNVVNLRIPPLRERRDDIPILADFFLERIEQETGRPHRLSDDSLRLLADYDWPGNVRELQHAIERTCAMSSGPILHTVDLPTQLQDFSAHLRQDALAANALHSETSTHAPDGVVSIADMERQAILGTIRQLKGDKLMAARLLGIGKTTLYRKLKEYGVSDSTDSFDE